MPLQASELKLSASSKEQKTVPTAVKLCNRVDIAIKML